MNTTSYEYAEDVKAPVWQLPSTLEQAVLAGFEDVGSIGTAFVYRVGKLALSWRVRVLTNQGEFIERAPYSLSMLSSCCEASAREWFDDENPAGFYCRQCEKLQSHITEGGALSILGQGRIYSLGHLETALSHLHDFGPLEAALAAQHIVADIERVHAEYMTPEWAFDTAEQVKRVYWPNGASLT